MRRRAVTYGLVVALTIAALITGSLVLNRPRLVSIDAELPAGFPTDDFSHVAFEELLVRYVDDAGYVNYGEWHASVTDRRQLDSYLAAVASYSPENEPGRFARRPDQLAYWMYAYNALVIKSILDRWPLDSVTDVRAPLELVTGLGFFYQQRFELGGRPYSLYAIENEKIRKQYRDARIHFVLNCGSESCPVMRPELPTGDDLEALLAEAATDFVGDQRNVRVDHAAQTVILSTIFKWYRKDFLNELVKQGLPGEHGLIDYIASVAPAATARELGRALEYEVVFEDYDWSVNAAR